MTEPLFRAVAVLKAKQGMEQQLLEFTVEALPLIRAVDGLRKVELSRSLSDPACLVLYYWWESPEHSQHYVAGPVYAQIAPRLESLAVEHLLVLGQVINA